MLPNNLEEQLRAVHSSIAEIKRQMNDCVNVKHYEVLQEQLVEYEKARDELLRQMEVEL